MFDLGGVIMDIDRDRCVRAFQNLGMTDADSFFDAYRQRGPFLLLESGKLDPDAFRREIRKLIPEEVTDGQIDAALCEFLIGIPSHRLDTLRRLRADGHKVWLLSNTNPIMWHRFILPEFTKQGHLLRSRDVQTRQRHLSVCAQQIRHKRGGNHIFRRRSRQHCRSRSPRHQRSAHQRTELNKLACLPCAMLLP